MSKCIVWGSQSEPFIRIANGEMSRCLFELPNNNNLFLLERAT